MRGTVKMKFFNEFKKFIARGNVIDMAVGIIIGSAFTKIVTSLVNDVITPVISIFTGKVNLTDLKWVISPKTELAEEVAVKYGVFIQSVIDFLIIALVVFTMVKLINNFHDKLIKKEEPEEEEETKPSNEEILLTEIRDLLKDKKDDN